VGVGGTLVVFTDEAGPVAVEAARSELDLLARQEVGLEPVVFSAEAPANLHITEAEYGEGLEGGSVRLVVVNHGAAAAEGAEAPEADAVVECELDAVCDGVAEPVVVSVAVTLTVAVEDTDTETLQGV
jgi:hypothetical protein